MKRKIISIVGVGVVKKGSQYLITKRIHPVKELNKWQFPGGGLNHGEKIEHCIIREIKEETGLDVKPVKFVPKIFEITRNFLGDWHGILIVYICKMTDERQKVVINNEASEYDWATANEVRKHDLLLGTAEIVNEVEKAS